MLSAMLGAPTRIRDEGSGTEYRGSKRSELLTETTVRASTRVVLSAGRGATADASAGAAARGAGAVVGSACGAVAVATTLEPAATSAGADFSGAAAVMSGAGTALAPCWTTLCSGRAATAVVGAGAVGAGAVGAGAVGAGAAGVEVEGEVETTTVEDLTSVVVQAPELVVELDVGAAAAGVPVEGGAATVVLAVGAGAAGVVAAGVVVELPALDDTFEPAGAAGDDGEACFAAVIVVSRGAVMVVSRRAVPVFDALRTLSVGRAGEADRAVARRTCSIIAE
jgi:hypothetical protein